MMKIRWYALDEHGDPVRITTQDDIGEAFADPRRIIAETMVGDARVSTVFLVLDHALFSDGPVLWETMIFGGEHDGYQDRYMSRAEAVAGHDRAVTLARPVQRRNE